VPVAGERKGWQKGLSQVGICHLSGDPKSKFVTFRAAGQDGASESVTFWPGIQEQPGQMGASLRNKGAKGPLWNGLSLSQVGICHLSGDRKSEFVTFRAAGPGRWVGKGHSLAGHSGTKGAKGPLWNGLSLVKSEFVTFRAIPSRNLSPLAVP
jgi:hypothetical protein